MQKQILMTFWKRLSINPSSKTSPRRWWKSEQELENYFQIKNIDSMNMNDLKNSKKAPVSTVTINKNDFDAPTGNIYEAISIAAKGCSK